MNFLEKYPDAREPIERWWEICRENNFSSLKDIKRTFGTADIVGKCVVFIIGGGKYGLVARTNLIGRRMWIKYIVPLKAYEKLNLKNPEEDSKCLP